MGGLPLGGESSKYPFVNACVKEMGNFYVIFMRRTVRDHAVYLIVKKNMEARGSFYGVFTHRALAEICEK